MAPLTIRKPNADGSATPSTLSPNSQPFSLPSTSTGATPSTSKLKPAPAFVPSPSPAPSSPLATPASQPSLALAQEFVPRQPLLEQQDDSRATTRVSLRRITTNSRADTHRRDRPALSEDSPFFSPPGAPLPPPVQHHASHLQLQQHAQPFTPGSAAAGQGHPQELEYFQQQMDLNDYVNAGGQGAYQHGQGGQGSQAAGAFYNPQIHGHAPPQSRQPLQYHLYHPPSMPSSSTAAHDSTYPPPAPSFFIPPSLHTQLSQRSEATLQPVDPSLPAQVGGYVGLVGLELHPSELGGLRTWIYKAFSPTTHGGGPVALRRIEGFRVQDGRSLESVDKWTRVRHPGLVGLKEAFTTRAWGDHSLVFVYEYHPLSQTLFDLHLSPNSQQSSYSATAASFRPSQNAGPNAGPRSLPGIPQPVPERLLWSYIVQLTAAIRAVHSAGLAVKGGLEMKKILVTGEKRVRIGSGGMGDVLGWEGAGMVGFQQDDLLSFGKLVLSLACSSLSAPHNLPKAIDLLSRMYSPEVKNVVLYLLGKPGPRKSVDEFASLIAARSLDELGASLVADDTLTTYLSRTLETGRLVRLLSKFGFINERPEFDHDARWAETGDRYIIKLFRDYVFHQVDENGRPVVDLSWVVTALNKLDAGVDEKIMLVSRDEQSCLIVTYREVKNCIESAFLDLSR